MQPVTNADCNGTAWLAAVELYSSRITLAPFERATRTLVVPKAAANAGGGREGVAVPVVVGVVVRVPVVVGVAVGVGVSLPVLLGDCVPVGVDVVVRAGVGVVDVDASEDRVAEVDAVIEAEADAEAVTDDVPEALEVAVGEAEA